MHLFRDCFFARDIGRCWEGMGLDLASFYNVDLREWLRLNLCGSLVICDSTSWASQFAMALWSIWESWNSLIFRQEIAHPTKVWHSARLIEREVHSSLGSTSSGRRGGVLVKWKPPDEGVLLLNTNRSFKASSGVPLLVD
ncbi:putative nuclease [Corchorus olitorius]|uniref:Nuclease n=1 Tax=Corchorus olitorius TaxID=93759 RepID=A0A1R3KDG7_9ROSI|nr:putative nuclease [Corchorus olitorius]